MVKLRGELLRRFTETNDWAQEMMPVVELAGDRRVLIENHGGVLEYGTERICVRMKYGVLHIEGNNLILSKMSGELLVICGRICGVKLERKRV